MNQRRLTVILSLTALAALALAGILQWREDGSLNIGVAILIPLVVVSLVLALRRKS